MIIKKKSIFSLLLFLIIVIACNNNNYVEYSDAIDSCKKLIRIDSVNKSKRIVFPSPDCLINAKAPNFSGIDVKKQKIFTNFQKSGFTLINFWFLECKPCVEEIPLLNEISKMKNITVVSVCKNNEKDIKNFMKKYEIIYPVIPNGNEIIYGIYKHIFGFPTSYLIDDNGVIIKVFYHLSKSSKDYKFLLDIIKNG